MVTELAFEIQDLVVASSVVDHDAVAAEHVLAPELRAVGHVARLALVRPRVGIGTLIAAGVASLAGPVAKEEVHVRATVVVEADAFAWVQGEAG